MDVIYQANKFTRYKPLRGLRQIKSLQTTRRAGRNKKIKRKEETKKMIEKERIKFKKELG